MSSRTHGDWFDRDEDDTPTDVHPVVQRPISVAALLKREGHDGPSQEGMTRRTLTGVAAGAVMVFSAAVGSLLLHHSDTPANTVAGSSNGDVLAADGAMVATTTPQANPQSLPTSTYNTTTPQVATPKVNTQPKTVTHSRTTTSTGGGAVATTPPAATTNPAPVTTTPTTTTPQSSTSTTTNKSGNGNSQSSTSTTTTTTNGGLLGTVTGTVNGVLGTVNGVTNTAFSWFSS